ncbi:hypothetical protein SAY86_022403 [Trapa natans]|uniref:GH3 C-terminal domain-containing protein n=1 Tax=Trapa natans TaxID=22666 RepID=A0AAN7LNC0_TRANT|nr:hypothetical protein SAY86_022403 [Trapa natans]
MERIANGQPSDIIFSQPITELLSSSGTSGGQQKLLPMTAEDLDRETFFYNLFVKILNKYVEGLDQGKAMYFLFIKPEISFHNKAPKFRFVQRQNVVLSIDVDKTSEEVLLHVVTEAKEHLEQLGLLLTEYTSYPDTSSIPGHYVIYWELKEKGSKSDFPVLDQGIVEESLDSVYGSCRRNEKSIGPLEIRVVREGTFDSLMDYCMLQGSSLSQYKTPRCIKSDAALKILNSRVIGSFSSQCVPSWDPFIMV